MSDPEPGPELEALRELARRLRAVAEPAMRRERLLELLEARDAPEGYALLAGLLSAGDPDLRETALDLLRSGGATRPVPYALEAGWYAEARRAGDDFVARLLRSPEAAESMADPSAALPRELAEVPLGVRRSLARGSDLPLLEKLLLDADERVVAHLLENPRIVEAHVVRIAARRPVPDSTLHEIARSRRFGHRPAVRLALVRNPYCPTDLAVRLLGGLSAPELRDVARDGTLHETTREHAAAELERRQATD